MLKQLRESETQFDDRKSEITKQAEDELKKNRAEAKVENAKVKILVDAANVEHETVKRRVQTAIDAWNNELRDQNAKLEMAKRSEGGMSYKVDGDIGGMEREEGQAESVTANAAQALARSTESLNDEAARKIVMEGNKISSGIKVAQALIRSKLTDVDSSLNYASTRMREDNTKVQAEMR